MQYEPSWRRSVLKLTEDDPKVQQVAAMTEWFCKAAVHNACENRRTVIVSGPPGTGKSHCARAVKAYLASRGIDKWLKGYWPKPPQTFFEEWSRLAGMKTDEAFNDALIDVREASFVILDDVGAEVDQFKSGAPSERLRRVLELCDKGRKWTYITSNVGEDAWAERYDERVADRLRGAWCVNLNGVKSRRGM